MHHEIAIAAAKAGKAILCEKPLALNCKEGEEMVREVEKAKVPNMVWYNYRRIPAVSLAKNMIEEGRLGKIYHYRSNFLQDWTINTDSATRRRRVMEIRCKGSWQWCNWRPSCTLY